MNKRIKSIISYLIVISILVISNHFGNAFAGVINDSESEHVVYNSDGDTSLKLYMKDGIIKIWAYSHTASTNIRWETIGFTITADEVNPSGASAKGITGPGPVNDAFDHGHGVILFQENEKGKDVITGNTTMTPYTVSAERIEKALERNFENITANTVIRLHMIFRTYQMVNGTKVIRAGKEGGLRNWKDIMEAEYWGTDTLSDFYKYFNMEIQFKPAPSSPQNNTLYYYTDDNIKMDSKALDSVLPGERVYWNNEDTERKYNNKSYSLMGYYVTEKTDNTKKMDERYTDDGWGIDRIRSGSAIVELGGMNVYLIYRRSSTITPKPTGSPTPTPKVTVTPTPTPRPSVTPRPTFPPVAIPVPEAPKTLPMDVPYPYGVINGDKYSAPYFTSEKGIPTTESQYVYVKSKDYLLGYTIVNRTGKKAFSVPVTMNYTIEYYTATPPEFGGPKKITETVSDTQIIKVERAYSYWEITNLEYYNVNNARINNYSLPNGMVNLTVNVTHLNLPSLSTSHNSDINSHVLAPAQVASGITLNSSSNYSSTSSDRPIVEYEDLTYYAQTMTDQAQVKNDYLQFGESLVLSDSLSSKIAPSPNVSSFVHTTNIIHDKALYIENKVIDAEKINGVYPSTGTVTYTLHPDSVNSSYSSKTYNMSVNDVTIHTPVICVPVITADNKKWSQLINPSEDAVQIVLDPDNTLNDFDVSISNTLKHSNRLGYLSRDFSRSFIDPNFISYIARQDGIVKNEVKFPFDVYLDTYRDKNKENDKYIKAGTWIVLGRDTFHLYVPMWVQEGIYTAEFRSIAVNGTDKLSQIEGTKNADINNYVATSSAKFEISGRLYGLKIYDVSDYPKWENVFRLNKTMNFKLFEGAVDGTRKSVFNDTYAYYYPVGTKDQYGNDTGILNRFTLPLINGSHPKYNNLGALKTGYAIRFMLDTTGEMYSGANCIKITPTFYYVDSEGKNRKRVDLYYDEEINRKSYHLVKIGEGVDLVNLKSGMTGNIFSRIPESELRNTAKVLDTTYSKLYYKSNTMYAYSTFRLLNEFRTFIGTKYARDIIVLPSFDQVKEYTNLNANQLSKYQQRWYGTYKLPTDVHAVEAGYDVYEYLRKYGIDYNEDYWLKDGYIIVNFNIVTIDKSGKERLSYLNGNNYVNNGNCSMWVTEGSIIQKTDNKGVKFNFKAGDILLFYADKKYSDDYVGRIY